MNYKKAFKEEVKLRHYYQDRYFKLKESVSCYVLLVTDGHHGSTIEGVFSTEDSAKNAKEESEKTMIYGDFLYIESHKIQDDL